MPASPCIELTASEQSQLLSVARQSLEDYFDDQTPSETSFPASAALASRAGCFVSLFLGGELAGCMGCLQASRPLGETIPELAINSAFFDHRFAPLTRSQLSRLRIEVSILSPLRPLSIEDRPALASYLASRHCGLVLTEDTRRAVFLPQVWDGIADADEFISALLHKGGWPADYWSDKIQIETFDVQHFGEANSGAPASQ